MIGAGCPRIRYIALYVGNACGQDASSPMLLKLSIAYFSEATPQLHTLFRRSRPPSMRVTIDQLRRTGKTFACAVPRAKWAGRPVKPGCYTILALVVASVVLAVMLSVSATGEELRSAVRLSWWFS